MPHDGLQPRPCDSLVSVLTSASGWGEKKAKKDTFNKLTSVFFYASVPSLIMKFVVTLSKLLQISRVDLRSTLTMLGPNSLPIKGQTHEKLASTSLLSITNCQIVHSRSLTHRINYNFLCMSVKITLHSTIERPWLTLQACRRVASNLLQLSVSREDRKMRAGEGKTNRL